MVTIFFCYRLSLTIWCSLTYVLADIFIWFKKYTTVLKIKRKVDKIQWTRSLIGFTNNNIEVNKEGMFSVTLKFEFKFILFGSKIGNDNFLRKWKSYRKPKLMIMWAKIANHRKLRLIIDYTFCHLCDNKPWFIIAPFSCREKTSIAKN